MNNSELKRTRNAFRCVGTVSENALVREECKIKVRDEEGNAAGSVDGERIRGRIALSTKTGIHTFDVYAQNITSKNKPNQMWESFEAMLDWKPQIGGDGEPAMVAVDGSVAINDYVGKTGEVSTSLRWNVRRGNTRVKADEETGCTLEAVAFIQSIKPETKTVDGEAEETGRLSVTLMGVGSNGDCFPINCFVDENMAEAFTDNYEIGQSVNFTLELTTTHIGGVAPKKKAFGKAGSVAVNSGYDKQELMIYGADDPIEEPDEDSLVDEDGKAVEDKSGYINPIAMKKAIKARAAMLDELKNNPQSKGGKDSKPDIKGAKKAMNKAKPKFEEFEDTGEDDDELPF